MADATTFAPDSPANHPDPTGAQYAAQMRARGYKQVTRWVLDLSNPEVLAEYRRQRVALAEHQRKHPEELLELTAEDLEGWV